MQVFTLPPLARTQFRAWLITALIVLTGTSAARAGAIYSNDGQASTSNTYSVVKVGPVVVSENGIEHPERAADANLTNFATINTGLGILAFTKLQLGLNAGSPGGRAGDRAGVLVGNVATNDNLVNFNGLGVIRLRTYKAGALQETQVVSAAVARDILLSGDRPTQLEFIAAKAFDRIDLEVGGVVGVSYKLKVYYAYAVPSLMQQQARGLISRFSGAGSALAPYYGTGTGGVGVLSACVGAGIYNPENAVDNDLSNYATFNSLATVSCPSALTVKLEGARPAPAGYYAGFVIGSDGVLDASVLSGLRVTTYLNGVAQESYTGAGVLELRVLPDGKTQVSFPTDFPFDAVKIERVGLLTVLDNLEIYYGFGVEPKAFEGTTEVLSDFTPNQTAGHYEVKSNSVVCLTSCGVLNPAGAADNDPNTQAVITVPTSVLSNVELKLDLNGTGTNVGQAGNRAGMVIGDGINLLDVTLLDRITLTTYDAAGKVLESASGRSLLSLNLLPDGRQELSFLTTQNFASVQLSVAGGVSALVNIPISYAFADDRSGGLPSLIVPLPVELTAFSGRWANGAAELNWATASEKNSSHFVVERSTGREAAFQAVGQVKSAGNSTSLKRYQLRDAEAAAQGVAILYYRLRQVDLDGQQVYSPVVSVVVGARTAAAPGLEVYPNPAADANAVTVQCPNLPATGGLVQVYSQLGQVVSQQQVTEGAASLALPGLAPGLYHVVLRSAAGQTLATQRLVVVGQ
ncbi:T9SS type A sorting domain-containing protein [Hymenobacter sp. BT770]|uniref:T9SS type A sorting domain-containing protein n=1 Tax=Hymenobacter sp. BT770 TaxID=2886942 RepID=UPI001D100592|nr:T9SS type A sorting domain-containing protein [Hymenobacter sp. BT770]MCC3154491.1 T9SS type A sorting domain-containing protein [Hymenobacter sp. BT770]MDO3416445.1 T9SS type A sorting domain-containing protein [Hymenobacter sp. BT770]